MPNHVQNRIHLDGEKGKIKEMLEKIQNEEYGIGTVDFQKILPIPSFIPENQRIDWCRGNWGTKWNAYDYEPDVDYSNSQILEFWTAWSAPHPLMEKLSQMFPEIEFVHEWADEDLGVNCGKRTYQNGEIYEQYYPETEKERMEFACAVWGGTPETMGFAYDKKSRCYEYIGFESETIEQNPA